MVCPRPLHAALCRLHPVHLLRLHVPLPHLYLGSIPARMYGSPKMHKIKDRNSVDVPPHRPIVSSIGSFNYNLAKYLAGVLTPHIPMNYSATDTFTFIDDLKKVSLPNKYLVSFDVVSFFYQYTLTGDS